MADPATELPTTAQVMPGTGQPIAPGVAQEPVPVLVGRWLMLGCGATALVLVVAAALLAWVTAVGVFEK